MTATFFISENLTTEHTKMFAKEREVLEFLCASL